MTNSLTSMLGLSRCCLSRFYTRLMIQQCFGGCIHDFGDTWDAIIDIASTNKTLQVCSKTRSPTPRITFCQRSRRCSVYRSSFGVQWPPHHPLHGLALM
ncbi:hypothetical protein K402DRAFT_42476 [Aulographum hederae CBS 113979]|uniref:Uncharacterized protein n=1 Tax=Aulographum hederae CBS 113979 TaxID=1176131 RepID=A0A6G1H3R8_9PEZI|nr:hypothetical protein K402DRAFT_42476 [Aulographum hederae CBS 113979]